MPATVLEAKPPTPLVTNHSRRSAVGSSPNRLRDSPSARAPSGRRHLCSSLLEEFRHQTCPTGLVAGAYTTASVTVEVLVERHVIAPIPVLLKQAHVAKHWPSAIGPFEENGFEPARDFGGDLPQGALLA